jgi:glutamate-ammonia-ligase adenylyltransferase
VNNHPGVQKDFQKLLQKARAYFPNLEIDCRLRPEGKSSQLVWDLSNYKKYFDSRIRIWELQSLTKCRPITGNKNLFNKFFDSFINTIRKQNLLLIKNEMIEMRKKLTPINNLSFDIKKSSGGLLDINFIIEKYLLLNPELLISFIDQNTQSKIKKIAEIAGADFASKNIFEDYEFLKKVEISIQNTFDIKSAKIPTDEAKLYKLARVLKFKDNNSFISKLNSVNENIRKIYSITFEK